MDKYVLDGHRPVIVEDLLTWASWFERADRSVARTTSDDVTVSTVFIGINHAWGGGPPLLFETLVFGGPHDGLMRRCSTWEQAETQHRRVCEEVSLTYDVRN